MKFLNIFIILLSLPLFAKEIQFADGSRIEIRGDSSMRKFSAESKKIETRGTSDEKAAPGSPLPWTPLEVEIALPVKSLKSDSETLDEHMWERLKAEKNPKIQLKLNKFSFSKSDVTASGTLSVAGVTQDIELKALLNADGNKLAIRGTKTVLMTDFGIEPPTMMLGTIKTKNEIEVIFELNCLLDDKKKG